MEKIKNLFFYCGIFLLALMILCGNLENGILLTLASFLIIYLFVSKVKFKNFSIFLILFCLITKILAIFIIRTPIVGDFVLMYDTAKHIVMEGIYTPKHPYFNVWGYQLFHVFYEAVALSIWNSAVFLKILNCIYSTIITVLIYLISRKFTSEKTGRIVSLLYAISLYPIYLNTILGNQQLSLMIALWAVYLFLYKNNSLKMMAIIGILFGISHLERNEGIVYLLTSLIYLFFTSSNMKDSFSKVIVLLLCFFAVTKGSSLLVMRLGINEIGFGNANPEWKFLLGFNSKTYGMYDIDDEAYLGNLDLEHQEVINRMTDLKKWPSLFYNKIKIQFLYNDFGKAFDQDYSSSFASHMKEAIFNYIRMSNIVIIFFAFLGLYKNHNFKQEGSFFLINFLLFFGIFMLIEICARYYYNPQVTLFILASFGIERAISFIEHRNPMSV